MKKIIKGTAFTVLLFSLLYADSYDNTFGLNYDTPDYEQERRDSLSPAERDVEDLEKENRLKQRQRDAEAEKKRLEQETKDAEYEKKSTFEKAKSWFD